MSGSLTIRPSRANPQRKAATEFEGFMESTSLGDRQEMNCRLLKNGDWLQGFLLPVPVFQLKLERTRKRTQKQSINLDRGQNK